MAELRKRFGRLVAAHRRRAGMTQAVLAETASVSVDMVSKIEIGATGARFPVIERLAQALRVDPAELFSTEIPTGALNRGTFAGISARLARLSEADLVWIGNVMVAALRARGEAVVPGERSASGERERRGGKHMPLVRPPKPRKKG